MKKRIAALLAIGVLTLGSGTAALANVRCGGFGGGMRGIMWDYDGGFLSRDAFEARLDGLIADGFIHANDRAFYLEMYDFCGTYGGGFGNCALGGRRGGGRFGNRGNRRAW